LVSWDLEEVVRVVAGVDSSMLLGSEIYMFEAKKIDKPSLDFLDVLAVSYHEREQKYLSLELYVVGAALGAAVVKESLG
jgi:hypothetical protein